MNVMGISEVLLCPYRYLEHIMVNRRTQNSTLPLLPVPDNCASQVFVMPSVYPVYFLNEFTEG